MIFLKLLHWVWKAITKVVKQLNTTPINLRENNWSFDELVTSGNCIRWKIPGFLGAKCQESDKLSEVRHYFQIVDPSGLDMLSGHSDLSI